MRRGKLSIFLSGCAAVLFAGQASATAIYSYTGNNFNDVAGSYTVAMRVTATFTVASPLSANLTSEDILASVITFSMADGVQVLVAVRCHACGGRLVHPKSIARRLGQSCAARLSE